MLKKFGGLILALVLAIILFGCASSPTPTPTVTVIQTQPPQTLTATVTPQPSTVVVKETSTVTATVTLTPQPTTITPKPSPTTPPVLNFAEDIYHDGNFYNLVDKKTTLVKIAAEKGWTTSELNIAPLTFSLLLEKQIKVLYLRAGVGRSYTVQELDELQYFVLGGGIILIENYRDFRPLTRPLAQRFFIDIAPETFLNSTNDPSLTMVIQSNDPLLKNVKKLYFETILPYETQIFGLTPLTPAQKVLEKIGDIPSRSRTIIAKYENAYGGKILVFPYNLTINQRQEDNQIFLNNIFEWSLPKP